jgi:hypothetical protein
MIPEPIAHAMRAACAAIAARVARGHSWSCGAMAVLLTTLAAHASAGIDWRKPWSEPQDAAAASERSDEYAWRLFVALNWPADPTARIADRSARFGADRAVVWETWQSAGDVYLNGGADPGAWSRRRPYQPGALERRFESVSLKDLPNARHIVDGVMVPLVDPLAAAKRLTEIRMNRRTFDFIRAHELYNLDGQLRAYAAGSAISFPYGAREIKAKWRPISPGESSRYQTTLVTLADGTQRLYGLTALHIASKDLPNWFWATFEQVDNPTLADNEGWQLPSSDRFSCGKDPADCNRAPQDIGVEGTVWQYYRLRGTLTAFVQSDGGPRLLANSELEAGMQRTASCITCHSRSSIGVIAGAPARLGIFDASPGAPQHNAYERRGFSGLPRAEWYQGPDPAGRHRPIFQKLDFVWSLSKAKSKEGSAEIAPVLTRNLIPRPLAGGANLGGGGRSQ